MLLRNIFEGTSPYKSEIYNKDKLVEVLRNGYQKYFESQSSYMIFRGASDIGQAVGAVTNPRAQGRTSAHTSNEYTLLLSNDPSWSAYPKRSESIICANTTGGASSYGVVYAVIPPDSFRFGVVPARDLWDGFNAVNSVVGGYGGMDTFNSLLRGMIRDVQPDMVDRINTYEGLRQALENITHESTKDKKPDTNLLYKYIWEQLRTNTNRNAYDVVMQNLLNPQKNEFWLLSSHTDLSKLSNLSHELWTDSTCVLINYYDMSIDYKELQKEVLR